ncbi:competence type IV pilus minor pilin ComGD [Sinobaca sp. H24]|uniref:competence type IV pilus minor pilin ComGD n=1 Tax=Sinobaca sp. H24 TaxID=2923376 RepID=UPI00207AF253|nr:competence type IV pilus minor pilin ComGD [Sinobaca sp. H24]
MTPVFNEKGHTMTEMLIVLGILIIFTAWPIHSLYTFYQVKEIERFLHVLEEDLLFAQQYAYSHEEVTQFLFNSSAGSYSIKPFHSSAVKSKKMPEGVYVESASLKESDVVFTANGNIRRPGTLTIDTPNKRYRLVFLLGSGRFYIEPMG